MANEDLSYLSFLDDTQSEGRSDLSYLSFLNEPEVSDKTASQGFQGSGRYPKSLEGPQPRKRTIADSFQGAAPFPEELAGPQRPQAIPETKGPLHGPSRRKTLKEANADLKKMSVEQIMALAREVGGEKDWELDQFGKAIPSLAKGIASGASMTTSTYLDKLKPTEKDFLFGLGDAIGTAVPAYFLGSMFSAPLLAMAAKSPKYVAGLQALARMTGMGLTGATIKGGRELIQGEVPKPKELAKEAALWFALDGGLQAIGLANQFRQSVNRIAEQEGISNKEVLSQLWQATKNYTRQKFNRAIGRPETIRPDDIETLAQIVDQRAIQPGETIDITPEPPPKPKQLTQPPLKPELEQLPEKPIVEKPKREPRPAKVTETPAVIEAEAPKPKAEPIETTKAGEDEYRYFDPKKDFDVSKIQKLNEREYADHIKLAESQSPEVAKEVRKRAKLLYDLIDDYSVDRHDKKVVDLFSLEKKMEFLRDGIAREIMNEGNVKPTLQDLIDRMEAAGESPIKPIEAPAKEVAPDKPKAIEKPKVEAKPEPKPTEAPKAEKPAVKPKAEKKPKPKKSADTLASRISTKERKPKMGKGQTIAKQKMVQVLRDVFKDPIRIGKIRQRKALGIHKLWSRVSRLLHHNDVETAAHEIGHNLHGILYGGNAKNVKQFRQNAINALRPYLDELKPIAGYEPHELEGFAEFVRMYVTNPETIKALAPKFYDVFEAEMQAREPELLKGLLTVRNYYEDWINASPEARVEAQIDFDKETVTERVKKLYESGLVDKAVRHMIDEYRPAQRVEALIYDLPIHEIEEMGKPSLYRALRLLKNSPLNIEQYLYHGTFDPVTKETTGEALTDILQEIRTDKEWREFNNYLVSERVLELAKRDIKKGISIADVLATVKKHSKYKPLAKRFRAWIDRTLDYAVKSQLVKPEAAEAMRKAGLFYVPLQVEKPGSKAYAGLKKLQAKVPFFRIKGSTRRIVPPVEGAIKNLYQIITNADKNRVGLVLSKLAQEKGAGLYIEKVPTPMKLAGMVKTPEIEAAIIKHLIETGNTEFLIETDGKFALDPAIADILPETIMRFRPGSYRNEQNIVTVFENGKPQYYEVIPELYQMWSGVMDPQSAHFLLKMISPVTKLKRMSATLNIPFAVNNLIRDSWERLMYSRFPPNPRDVRDVAEHIFLPLKMLFDVAGHSELYNKYIRSGGGLSTLVSMDKTSLQTTAMEVRKGRHITMRKLFSPKYVVYLIRRMVEIGEEANKLAEFYRGIKTYGDTVLGRERAAFAARDLSIDHNRAGITGRGINQQTAFFNAGVQGGNKFYRRMRDPKTRAKTLFGMFAFVSVPSALAYLTVYDDDDYKELSAAERDRNLIFKAGGKFIKVPVPFEPGIIANGLVRRSLEYARTHDPEAFRGFAHSLFEGMLPPMLPDVAHAPLEIAANRDFFRDAPIVPKAKEGLLAREQYKESTSLTARLLGRWLSYLPGVDPQSKVASPAVIDHLILSYATRWGQLALGIFDKGVSASGAIDPGARPSRPITDQMGLNLFTIRYPRANTQSIQDFYETYAEIQALRKTQKFYEGEGRQDDADEMKKALDDKANPHRFDEAYKALQRLQALINRTYTDPGMDDETKQRYIDEMYLQKISIAREMIKEMREWKKQQQKD